MSRARPILLLLVIALLVIPGTAAPAQANWAGATGDTGCGDLNKADNRDHTYYESSLSTVFNGPATYGLNYVDSVAYVSTTSASAPTSTTDQVIYDNAYTSYCNRPWWRPGSGGTIGNTRCVSDNSANECEKHEVRLSTSWGNSSSATLNKRRSLVIHETGHALGLSHRSVSGEVMQPSITSILTFTSHDIDHFASLG